MGALSFMCVYISRLNSYSNKLIARTAKIRFNPVKSSCWQPVAVLAILDFYERL